MLSDRARLWTSVTLPGSWLEIVKGEGVIGGGRLAPRGDRENLEAAGIGVAGIVEMHGDEDAVGGDIGDGGALLKRDEGVIGAGHDDLDAFGLEELAGAETDVEGEVLFVAEDADSAFVMAAMAGVEDDGIHGVQAGDEFGAKAGLDDLREVQAGDDEPVGIRDDWEAEPLVDSVDDGEAAVEGELDGVLAVVQEERSGQGLGRGWREASG